MRSVLNKKKTTKTSAYQIRKKSMLFDKFYLLGSKSNIKLLFNDYDDDGMLALKKNRRAYHKPSIDKHSINIIRENIVVLVSLRIQLFLNVFQQANTWR